MSRDEEDKNTDFVCFAQNGDFIELFIVTLIENIEVRITKIDEEDSKILHMIILQHFLKQRVLVVLVKSDMKVMKKFCDFFRNFFNFLYLYFYQHLHKNQLVLSDHVWSWISIAVLELKSIG